MTWQPHAMTLLSTVLVQKTHLYLQVHHQLRSQLLSQLQLQLQLQLLLLKKVIFNLKGSLESNHAVMIPFCWSVQLSLHYFQQIAANQSQWQSIAATRAM